MTDGDPGAGGDGAVADAVRGRRCVAVALADGRVVDATAPLDDALGVSRAVAAGEANFYDGLAAAATDDPAAERIAAAADGAAADGPPVTVETEAGERTVRHVGTACPSGAGADRVELFEDVTRVGERSDRLDLLESLAERARDGLFATDGSGRVVYCNESFASWLGADATTPVGRQIERFVAERERSAWAAAVAALGPETERTREFEFRWRGRRVGLSVALTGRPGGGVLGAVRRPGRDAERADRVEQYRTLVENAADPMFVVDADDRIALANGAMGEFLGADPAALEGVPVCDPVPSEAAERIAAVLETVRAGDRRQWHDADLRLPDADGRDHRFEATFGPVRADGTVVGTVGTFRDVTERERRRTELERLRRLLAGVVRTDVAEGVREIGELADRLAETVDGESAALAGAIRDRAAVMAELVTKTAAVDRIVDTDPEPTTVALDEAVDRALSSVDGDAATAVDVDVPSVDVRAVPVVDLAVRNLVENAVEHGSTSSRSETDDAVEHGSTSNRPGADDAVEHGSTSSRSETDDAVEHGSTSPASGTGQDALAHSGESPTVSVTATVAERSVTLSVVDDGPGIPDAELSALERGAETPLEHGSGVGLWLVEWVVAKSGGDLSFATDDGTRATVRLDRADTTDGPPSGSDADRATAGESDGAAVRVCHLDPDRSATARIRDAAADVDPTVTVERVESVDDAVGALTSGRVDCLVTDRLDDPGWDRLADAAAATDAPVVCYAGAAHAADEARLTAVDSLVEKGTGTAPAAFLVEKVIALTGADTDAYRGGGPEAEAGESGGDTAGVGDSSDEDADGSSPGGALRVATEAGTAASVPSGHPGFVDAADPAADEAGVAVGTAAVGASRRRVGEWASTLSVDGDDLRVRYARDLTPAVERERRCALLSALVDHARDRISVVDANGEVVYHNEAFADALGHADMVGVHSAEFMAPGELEKGQLAVQRLLATPELDSEALDVAFETAGGERVTLAVHFAVRREGGEYAGVVNVARDVSGAAEDPRLERSRTLVESAGDPMFVVGADGRLALVNEALERLLGRPRSALRGTRVEAVFPTVTADDGTDEWWRPGGADRTFCARVRGADGDRHRYELTVADPDAFDGAVCTCREVTARERRAEELARLKRVLGRVLRHNLRNELTLVTGHAQLVARALADGDDAATDGTDGARDGGDAPDPLALVRSIQRASDDLAATAATARAAERALEPRDTQRVQPLSTVVDAAAEAAAEHHRPVATSTTLPADCSVLAPPPLPTAFEALFGALARDGDADAPTVRIRASEADGRVDVRVSLPDARVDRETVAPFVAPPEAVLDHHRDAGAWLFAWVLDRADGRAVLDEAEDSLAVVVTLPAAGPPTGEAPPE